MGKRPREKDGDREQPWRAHLAFALGAALLAGWYRDIFLFWDVEWSGNQGYYAHGPVVPVLAAVVIWLRRERLAAARRQPAWLGIAVVAAAGLLKIASTWVSGTGVEAFASVSFPVALWGIVLTVYGTAVARLLAEPAALLWLMCPLPGYLINEVSFPLQLASTRLATTLAMLAGIDALQEGTVIHLPDLSLFVGGTCSGFRSILSLLSLTAFAAAVSRLSRGRRLVLLLSALPIGLAANAVRIAAITAAADRWGRPGALQVHEVSGFVMLGLACVAVFATAKVLGWLEDTDTW
ncbi:MAG: exosortase/archaeosortase family protein [Armatimonadetes bacterium]|nr:exosortase/archaeosortase family protein [Armatimonadota bacterium]